MATEMKWLVALLLLVCGCAVRGERGTRKRDVCTQGMTAIEVFFRYRGCGPPRPSNMARELVDSLEYNFTVANLEYVFTNYCSSAMPRMVQCFGKNIRNCSAQQQSSLMEAARHTGFLCQPNSNRVSPGITYLLTRLSDADLLRNPACYPDNGRYIHELCSNRSMEAIGMTPRNWRILYNLTMEQMVPKVQTFSKTMVTCTVAQFRDNPDRCPQWRGVALANIRFVFFPILGNSVTITNQEIDELFGWVSEASQVSE